MKNLKYLFLNAILFVFSLQVFAENFANANEKAVPDAIYINGTVITVDPAQPYAEAFAVVDGRFSAVGTNVEIRRLATLSTTIIDLKGMTVTPGFNDTHVHPHTSYTEDTPYYTPWLGPDKIKDMDELVAALKKKADQLPPGTLVTGSRYQDSKLGRHPTRWDLDKASTVHPIRISHSSGHVSVVNSYILEASGVTKETANSSFDRDPDGTPNGVLRAGANVRNTGATNRAPSPPAEAQIEAYQECFREYMRKGITSIGIAGSSDWQRFATLRDNETTVRMAFMSSGSVASLKNRGIKYGDGDERLRYTAVKMFHGNSMSGNTCWVSEPHVNRPDGRTDYFGIPPSRSQDSLNRIFQDIHDAGFQIAVHSNGDREIDMVITAIERAQANNPRPDARHRIEHASIMTMPLLERAKKAGIILVFHTYMYEHGDKLEIYGEKRLEMVHPYRTAIDMGVLVAGHSDSPIATASAMLCLHDMVNRRGENGKLYGGNQRVTVEEAIKVWTLDGAFTTFEEDIKGSVTVGKLADFIVLRKDPRKVSPDAIKDIVIDATYIGGVNVWQAPEHAQAAIHRFGADVHFGDGDEEENHHYHHQ